MAECEGVLKRSEVGLFGFPRVHEMKSAIQRDLIKAPLLRTPFPNL